MITRCRTSGEGPFFVLNFITNCMKCVRLRVRSDHARRNLAIIRKQIRKRVTNSSSDSRERRQLASIATVFQAYKFCSKSAARRSFLTVNSKCRDLAACMRRRFHRPEFLIKPSLYCILGPWLQVPSAASSKLSTNSCQEIRLSWIAHVLHLHCSNATRKVKSARRANFLQLDECASAACKTYVAQHRRAVLFRCRWTILPKSR